MEITVDARGMQCPLPVIETKKVLQKLTNGIVQVFVDNHIAVQNLSKMAKQLNLVSSYEKISEDYYIVFIVKKEQSEDSISMSEYENNLSVQSLTGESIDLENVNITEDAEKGNQDNNTDDISNNTTVVISANHMGEGDEKLGKALMKAFIYALTELDQLPAKMIFYNGGAKLTVEGSDSLEDLRLLESQGVEILTCGTCLNYYNISEILAVGTVTNMYAIAEILMSSNNIIKP